MSCCVKVMAGSGDRTNNMKQLHHSAQQQSDDSHRSSRDTTAGATSPVGVITTSQQLYSQWLLASITNQWLNWDSPPSSAM